MRFLGFVEDNAVKEASALPTQGGDVHVDLKAAPGKQLWTNEQ